jgi:hypothetical protein
MAAGGVEHEAGDKKQRGDPDWNAPAIASSAGHHRALIEIWVRGPVNIVAIVHHLPSSGFVMRGKATRYASSCFTAEVRRSSIIWSMLGSSYKLVNTPSM